MLGLLGLPLGGVRTAGSTGIIAASEAPDVAAFGDFDNTFFGGRYFGARYFGVRYWGGTPIKVIVGTLAATEATDEAAITGDVFTEGVLAATEAADAAAFVGAAEWRAILAATEETDVAGFVGFTATPATTDWIFPTESEVVSGGGWINPENIYAKDGAMTEAHHNEVGADWFLKTEGFGINAAVIPDDAVILKVELGVTWNVSPP